MPVGTEIVGPFHEPSEQRALLELEIIGRFSKIAARPQLDAPRAAAEIDGIEIELEDFRLAERALDPRRHDHLADLALVGEVIAHQQVLHDLLGDGRAALRPPGLGEAIDEGADQAALVDPVVLVEAFVLGREEGFLHVLGDIGERNPHSALVLLEDFGERPTVAVEEDAGTWKLHAFELGMVGQVSCRLVVEIDHVGEVDGRHRYFLVRAELTISCLQVAKIDSSKQLVLAGDRLRIIEGGGDEIVEIDVVDVEGLAHMRAARPQQLRGLVLIAAAVELRLHRIWRGRDLTERESGGKDLRKDGLHAMDWPCAAFCSMATLSGKLSEGVKFQFLQRYLRRRLLWIPCTFLAIVNAPGNEKTLW